MRNSVIAILYALVLTSCEGTRATSGVNILLDGKKVAVHEGTRIDTRDPKTGRFIQPRIQ